MHQFVKQLRQCMSLGHKRTHVRARTLHSEETIPAGAKNVFEQTSATRPSFGVRSYRVQLI